MDRLSHHHVRFSKPAIHPHPNFRLCFVFLLLLLLPALSTAQTKRVVVVKVDGLPYGLLDSCVAERDARTGKSQLPWIDHIFYHHGTRLANFYVRGMSLSAPSWSMLDTGQHLQIKGNVEFDRYTLHAYDYLNIIHDRIGKGIDIRGYYHWSTWDNFEWNLGPSYRFGLYACDPQTKARIKRPSADVYSALAHSKKLVIPEQKNASI